MKQLSYRIKFLTPAFLGNAEQNGQWRSPPIKALLRQWWRVAVAEELKFNVDAIRSREADLFGVAADGGDSHKSRVRIRLSRWDDGKLKNWESTGPIAHPEVSKPVGSDLYLGYGPLAFSQGKTALKNNAAIQAGEDATFSLAYPETYSKELETALWLMDRFGTIGGRSRNGWGSLSLILADEETPDLHGTVPVSNWQDALRIDWPHVLGSDGEPLIWQTRRQTDWKSVMVDLAKIKIGLRTQFTFNSGKNAAVPEERHWLSYPVTNHSVQAWKEGRKDFRLPNSLRFKVRQGEAGKLYGVIFHMPCKPPAVFRSNTTALEDVWGQVYQYLDSDKAPVTRIAE